MLAVNALAGRGERQAVPRLRELAADDRPLPAVAFRHVVAIESPEARQLLLAARAGPAPVARVGRQLFDETDEVTGGAAGAAIPTWRVGARARTTGERRR